jgi:Protein of unknown function (DUF3014)
VPETPDYDLIRPPDEPTTEPPRERTTGPWPLLTILVAIAVLVGAYYFVRSRRPAPTTPAAAAEPAPAPPAAPLGSNPFPADVPPLDASDPFVRQWLPRLSSHPRVAVWLTTDGLIRNFVTVTSNIAEGATPAGRLRVLKPTATFQVRSRGNAVEIDPRSYARYDGLAAALDSLDRTGTSQLYATLKPRIEEAHAELGGAGSFDRTLERAIVVLLETPVRDGPIAVEPHGIGYRYADPRLEGLSAAQRHLLRMGPANARLVKQSLRELAIALGIPASRLPAQ